MANAKHDQNHVPTLIGVSSSDGSTPINVYVNPVTHRLLVDSAAGSGIASINSDTTSAQTLDVGTTGTDFAIDDDGVGTHTFNLPTASHTNRGSLSSADWDTFNAKQAALVSGTNIKTVNSTSLLGSGDVAVGTVTSVATGTGLIGGTITSTGTISLSTALQPIASLTGNSLKYLRVNVGETAVEYASISGTGDVVGPASATDNAVVRFDSTTGKLVQNSGVIVDDSNNVSGVATLTTTGNIELGNASDTTISRSAAGVIAVEGVVIPSISSTNTLTNKRVTKRVATTNAPGATPTTNTDNVDIQTFTGLGTAITSMTTNLSGTPVDGDKLEFRFIDDGTARAITWGSSFASSGSVTLPTTTVISTTLRVGFEYSTIASLNKWVCIAVA